VSVITWISAALLVAVLVVVQETFGWYGLALTLLCVLIVVLAGVVDLP
jgi:hypothetical protein